MLIHDLPIDEYHSRPEVSKSGLDDLNQSPAIYFARHLNPDRPAVEPKSGQLEGQLAHCAILEPDEFGKRYAIGPTVRRNTKVWTEFVDSLAPGIVAIQQDQADVAWRQAESVRALPEIREALLRGRAEVSAFWTDPVTGVKCRCRPDWVHQCNETSVILIDVKTYGSASPDEFRRQAARKRYHVQDAYYGDGFEHASELAVLAFIFVAVETEWPYASNAMMLDGASRDQGRFDYSRDLGVYAQCQQSGEWPGYSKEIQLITLPAWAFQD
jgi:hypothetical protein